MDPDAYCREQVASSGSSFHLSFLFLPPDQRRAITALYAFCRAVDDIVDECSDPQVAGTKLQWWRTEVERGFDGSPQHPVTRALQPALGQFDLQREYFHEIIDGMEMDLEVHSYSTFKELSLYCHRVAGVVGILSASIFGYENHHTLRYAHDLGIAFQLTNILRDVREDARRGRVYIPEDEMAYHGVTRTELHDGIMTEGVRALLSAQARRAHDYYAMAFQKLPEKDRYRQRAGVIMAQIYLALLRRIEAEHFPVLERRVALNPIRKLWIAWSTARRESKRHRRYLRLAGE